MSAKIIEIVVSPSGQMRLETKGFPGAECRDASRLLEAALGKTTSDQPTAEHFQSEPLRSHQHLQQ